MKKIGKKLLHIHFLVPLLALLLSGPQLFAQDQELSVEATVSETKVFIGEQFTLSIEIRGGSLRNVDMPQIPAINGLRVLSSTPSRSQSISIVNGRTTTTTSYSYTLIARDQGSHRIPSISVTVDGEAYQTRPVTIEVIEQDSIHSDPDQRRPDIFSTIELTDENPTIGQQLIASVVIYFKDGIEVTSYQPSPGWRTDGFWKEELQNIEQPRAETVILGNVRYRKATLLRYALFPSRSGTLTLSPFTLNLGVRSQPRRNDPFGSVFGGLGTNQRRVTIETEMKEVDVRRLEAPENAQSIGAVGDFEIDRQISVRQAYIGESIELTTTVTGTGNIPLISKPNYTYPDNFETYQPQEETSLDRRGTTIRGTKTFKDVFVPRIAGTYTIPEKAIAVYNPQISRYTLHNLPPITIEVIRDPDATLVSMDDQISLQPLTGLTVWNTQRESSILKMYWIWIGVLIPLIALVIGYRKKRLRDKLATDSTYARAHNAWNNVVDRLEQARTELDKGHYKNTYNLLHKALTSFITDRLGLPEAGLSDKEIIQNLDNHGDHPIALRELKQIMSKCATISYAPVGGDQDVIDDINRTEELLRKLRSIL